MTQLTRVCLNLGRSQKFNALKCLRGCFYPALLFLVSEIGFSGKKSLGEHFNSLAKIFK